MTTEETPWWKEVSSADAQRSSLVIRQFLDNPTADDSDKISLVLTLFILLGGNDLSIREKIDNVDGYPQASIVRGVLSESRRRLKQFQGATPDWLEGSLKEIESRSAKAFDDHIDQIMRAAGRIVLKPS